MLDAKKRRLSQDARKTKRVKNSSLYCKSRGDGCKPTRTGQRKKTHDDTIDAQGCHLAFKKARLVLFDLF